MRTRIAAIAATASLAMLAVACQSGEDTPGTTTPTSTVAPTQTPSQPTPTASAQNFNVAFSEKPRVEQPDVPLADIRELADGNNAFALDLYGQLAESEESNLFMSPYSISLALAMTYAGAAGGTADEIADTLHFTLEQQRLHAAFNALDQMLAARGAELEPDQKFTLEIANSIWGQNGFEFEQPFIDTLGENYGAGMRLVDYENAAEEARLAINGWVEENTNDRIKDLIPQGALDDSTVLVLANAIFFKASWAQEFNPDLTADGDFHLSDGSTVTAEMMRQPAQWFSATDGDGYSAIEIPYVGGETSMVVVMPDEGEYEEFEQSLDSIQIQQIIDGLGREYLDLKFPKFSFESKFSLPQPLQELGMQQAFSDTAADFSNMRTPPPNLVITDVVHQSFIAVDEQGTEAAAATAVIVGTTSAPPPPEPFTVDRPFIFLIRDIETGTVLFLGRVLDPTA